MSASPYTLPQGFLRVAGQQLGVDLAALLAPDPTTGKSMLEGFDPSLTLSPLPYGTKKSRGGALGYKQAPMPSAGSFTLVPKTSGGLPGGGTPKAQLSAKYGNSPTIFGTQDYDVAKSLGYDDAAIEKYLKDSNITLGDDIAKKFNLLNQSWDYKAPGFPSSATPAAPAAPAAPGGTASSRGALSTKFGNDPNIFGTQDYEVGKLLNYSDAEIEDYVKKGTFQLGDDIATKFNLPTRSYAYKAPTSAPAAPAAPGGTASSRGALSTKFGNDPNIFGTQDYEAGKLANYSDAEIEDYIKQGTFQLGDDIATKFNLPTRSYAYKAPTSAPAASQTPTPTPAQPSFTKSVTSFDLKKDSQGKSEIQTSSSDYFGVPRPILSTEYGNDPGIFGTKDLAEAKAKNFADDEIARWLYDKNIPVGDDIPDALGADNKTRLAGQIYKNYKLNGVQYT